MWVGRDELDEPGHDPHMGPDVGRTRLEVSGFMLRPRQARRYADERVLVDIMPLDRDRVSRA